MSRPGPHPERFTLTYDPSIAEDLAALDPDERHAARAILDDLARGAVTGKELGGRHVSGDLTGYARVKFDVPGRHPQLLRLVYRQLGPDARRVFAIGRRDDHAVYLLAVDRLGRRS